jgi:hypothetical protein
MIMGGGLRFGLTSGGGEGHGMRVNGSFTLNAPADQVWAVLTDPAVLAGAIPGCEGLESGEGPTRLIVTATVAATAAAYAVDAHVTDRRRPDSLAVALEARGEPGSVTGTLQLRLADSDGATQVSYEADAEAVGQLAAVGRSLLAATVRRLATRFFEALGEALTREPDLATVGAVQPGVTPATAAAAGQHVAPAAAVGDSATTAVPQADAAAAARAGATAQAASLSDTGAAARVAEPPAAVPVGAAPSDLAVAARQRRPGQGFTPGVLVGAAIGVAAAKLGSFLARRNR